MIKAQDFFSHQITDNQLSPLLIKDFIELSEDFYCNTHNRRNKKEKRKEAICDFLQDLRNELEKIDLNQYEISYLIDDNEFDFNLDNTILNISGKNFDDTKISSGNIVGSFTLKGVQLNINCRFGNQFLAYMIASTSGYIELENFGGISNQKSLGEWILLLYWKNRLKHAFAQGIYKSYKKKRENLTTVRGAIDINQWLKKDFFDGKTLCEFKEHSYDNNINKIVYLAIQKISKSLYSNLLNDIYEIKRAFMNIPFSNLNHNFVDDRVSNPYYKNYNEVYNLSKQILQDKFMNLSSDKLNFSAFLFDISLLFEHHVRKVLKRKYMLKPKDLVEFKVPNGITENNLFPDIIIDYGDNNIGVFDVKYKRFKTEGKYKGVNREDRFQLISYVAYYSNKYNVINSGFIYPCEEEGFVDKNRDLNSCQFIKINGKEIPFGIYFYKVKSDMNLQLEEDIKFLDNFTIHKKNMPLLNRSYSPANFSA